MTDESKDQEIEMEEAEKGDEGNPTITVIVNGPGQYSIQVDPRVDPYTIPTVLRKVANSTENSLV